MWEIGSEFPLVAPPLHPYFYFSIGCVVDFNEWTGKGAGRPGKELSHQEDIDSSCSYGYGGEFRGREKVVEAGKGAQMSYKSLFPNLTVTTQQQELSHSRAGR